MKIQMGVSGAPDENMVFRQGLDMKKWNECRYVTQMIRVSPRQSFQTRPPVMSHPLGDQLQALVREVISEHHAPKNSPHPKLLLVLRRFWLPSGLDLALPLNTALPADQGILVIVAPDDTERKRTDWAAALLWIASPQAAFSLAKIDRPLNARLVTHFKVWWKAAEPELALEQSLTASTSTWIPPPFVQPVDPTVAYAQLLHDADLLLAVAHPPFSMVPECFLTEAVACWATNVMWQGSRATLQRTHMMQLQGSAAVAHWLAQEYVLSRLCHADAVSRQQRMVSKQPPSVVTTLEWTTAIAILPWPASKIAAVTAQFVATTDLRDQGTVPRMNYDLWILPYRQNRSLAISAWVQHAPTWPPPSLQSTLQPIDELLLRASPNLAAAVKQKYGASRFGPPPSTAQSKSVVEDERNRLLVESRRVRRSVHKLADLAIHMPPCIAKIRAKGLKNHGLKFMDRYYSAAYFSAIGQGIIDETIPINMRLPSAVSEVVKFMTGQSSSDTDDSTVDYVDALKTMLPPAYGRIWTCDGLRNKRGVPQAREDEEGEKTGRTMHDGSVAACQFLDSGACVAAAGLEIKNNGNLVYPSNWTKLSVAKAGLQ
jgi:hypothetical protein